MKLHRLPHAELVKLNPVQAMLELVASGKPRLDQDLEESRQNEIPPVIPAVAERHISPLFRNPNFQHNSLKKAVDAGSD